MTLTAAQELLQQVCCSAGRQMQNEGAAILLHLADSTSFSKPLRVCMGRKCVYVGRETPHVGILGPALNGIDSTSFAREMLCCRNDQDCRPGILQPFHDDCFCNSGV